MSTITIPDEFGKGGAHLTDQGETGLHAILTAMVASLENNDRILRQHSIALTTTTSTTTTSNSTTTTS